MSQLAQSILAHAAALPEGYVLSPKEFLHVATREAVDQALSRLARSGTLLRVGRGLYAAPVHGRFGLRPPSSERVLTALAEKTGENTVPHGAAEANALGLTTQVPVREIFLTSGRSRTLHLGARTLELKHAAPWLLLFGKSTAGTVLRALAALGQKRVELLLPQLRRQITAETWETLATVRTELPSWLAKTVSRMRHA